MTGPGSMRPDTSLLVPMERKGLEADERIAQHRAGAEAARDTVDGRERRGLLARLRRLLGR